MLPRGQAGGDQKDAIGFGCGEVTSDVWESHVSKEVRLDGRRIVAGKENKQI